MTVLLLDERWPTLIPMQAHGRLAGPVSFTSEVPVKVRWNFSDLVTGETPEGLLVTTDDNDPEARRRIAAGEAVIEAESRQDPVGQAQRVMTRALHIGEWERAQTHTSLLPYLEEESAEFAEAVRSGAAEAELCAELGDVFLQVLFHAEIASRRGAFEFADVAASFVNKMRQRSPYLFDGTRTVVPSEEQERLWREGKARSRRS
ncbi:MazG nucleotide pyrophosphohydrolase domain-containing protein [Corynebacterium sp. 32222D000AT]|uniref:MazG nucleotide pyrophosphohydrolase domain-containing protein n=1 Tax=unclassified Corynebacterium TaxID=2624378 RepID=UPI002A92FB49|nr:MazG nucleotide pyrophosphohydrolase domain-containing protein [Mycobacteriaceae bacterium]MDY5828700.1 MazG nucleotide pyrophosphohydrolase domain-containing protein [Corynebacterium sp.]